MTLVRDLWVRLETVHAVTYFGDESRAAARECGLRGFWMGYFGFRAAPLGVVQADIVESAFYNFAPSMVQRSVPDAWSFASPADLVRERSAAAAATLRRVGSAHLDRAIDARPKLRAATVAHDAEFGPLARANRALPDPTNEIEDLWQLCTTLREQRGDAHVRALRDADVSGCQAHLLVVAERRLPDELLRDNRGWTTDEWDAHWKTLVERGLIDPNGDLTDLGRDLRRRIEHSTDTAADSCWRHIDGRAVADVCELLDPLARAIVASGTIPYPNPMGLPTPI